MSPWNRICAQITQQQYGKRETYLQIRKKFDTKSDKVYISMHYEYVASVINCDYYRRISLVEHVPIHTHSDNYVMQLILF
jgi:hypothetical protein